MSLAKTFEKSYKKHWDDLVDEAEDILKEEAHEDTGALRDSITTEKSGYKAKIGVDAGKLMSDRRNESGFDYSNSYWTGHKPIVPKRAKVLHWVDKGGNDVFTKYVGATNGDPFVERAIKRVRKLGG